MTEKELKEQIINKIREKYNMNVYQFSNSPYPAKIGVHSGNTFRCYLTGPHGPVDFFNKLCLWLGMGEIERRVEVIKKIDFILHSPKEVKKTREKRRLLGKGKSPRKLGKK